MHNVFHVFWLKFFQGTLPTNVPDEEQPDIIDEVEVLQPIQIVLHKFKHESEKKVRRYLTKYKDRGTHQAIWLDEDSFCEYSDLPTTTYQEVMQIGPTST